MERLLTMREVERLTGFKKSSVYSFIEAGDFPRPIKIGRSSRWPSGDVSHWIHETIQRGRTFDLPKEAV
jgi:prophage regulatory protein